jgi:hypothetical protein
VRALGLGSWAVHSDCTIADNGWHGVSALQGGSVFIQKSSLTRNLGSGVNAFSRCSLAVLVQQYLLTGTRVQILVSTPAAGVARLHFWSTVVLPTF